MKQFTTLKDTLVEKHPDLELLERQVLAPYTTFKIGGEAPLIAFPATKEELKGCVATATELGISYFVMGNGSNLLVADAGVERFIIHTKHFQQIILLDDHQVLVQSGVLLSRLATYAAKYQMSGVEFAHGIPGSFGGAVRMNAGAYEGEMSQVVKSVTSLTRDGVMITRRANDLEFSYRHSLFTDLDEVILEAVIGLAPEASQVILNQMSEFSQRRRDSQPIEMPSAGSTFKRPPDQFAGALIDQCGLKGLMVGGAMVSEKHAGFVVNTGGATCADVLELVKKIKETVLDKTGVTLELEVEYFS
ncbi:MAG: UDP-N-acetylmuramate dehydrogenase [Eubacteriales bacterium]